tara:strand:- start:733 stop:1500 length:768 start_codon:yes stop_codon:yes gene_type:complete
MSKVKLAVCFYGQVRYIEGFNLYYKNFKDNNPDLEIDFFISTWKDFDINKINLIFKEATFVLDNNLGQAPLTGNTRKMAFHLKKVLELKSQHELKTKIKYDAVLTIRPDVIFDTTKMIDSILEFTSIEHKDPTVSLPEGITIQDKTYRLHEDWMFLMNSAGADLHSKIFDFFYVDQEYEKKNWNYREGGHWIHAHYFLHKNFNVVINNISNMLIRPVRDLEILKQHYSSTDLIHTLIKNLRKYKINPETFKKPII